MTATTPSEPAAAQPAACPLAGELFESDADAFYAQLRRQQGPVARIELEPGVHGWLVLGYPEALEVLRNPRLYSHDARRWADLKTGKLPADSNLLAMMGYRPNVLFADGEEHTRLHQAVADGFAGIDEHELREQVGRIAESLIDSFADAGGADLRAQYAQQLPLLVINRLFGLDDEKADQRLVDIVTRIWDGSDAEQASREYEAFMAELVAAKQAEPGADVTSRLVAHPAELTDEELVQHLVLIIGAGNQPTANLISNTLLVMLTDERFHASVAGGLTTIDDAIDDVLWRNPPIQNYAVHYPTEDVTLGTTEIGAGEPVIIGIAAANADPATGEHAHGNRAHLAWSAGPHTCPAQDPARLIVTTAVETLYHRLPDLKLAVKVDQLTWRPSLFARDLVALPVTFAPVDTAPEDDAAKAEDKPATTDSATGEPAWTPPAPDSTPKQEQQQGTEKQQEAAPSTSTPREPTSSASPADSAPRPRRSWWSFLVGWLRGR